METVSDRIKIVFHESGKTKSEIARLLDVAPSYISKLTNSADAVPSSRLISSISQVFNISEEWLLTGNGPKVPPKTRAQEIAEFAATLLNDSPDSARSVIISNLMRLDVEDWEAIARILKKLSPPQ